MRHFLKANEVDKLTLFKHTKEVADLKTILLNKKMLYNNLIYLYLLQYNLQKFYELN